MYMYTDYDWYIGKDSLQIDIGCYFINSWDVLFLNYSRKHFKVENKKYFHICFDWDVFYAPIILIFFYKFLPTTLSTWVDENFWNFHI